MWPFKNPVLFIHFSSGVQIMKISMATFAHTQYHLFTLISLPILGGYVWRRGFLPKPNIWIPLRICNYIWSCLQTFIQEILHFLISPRIFWLLIFLELVYWDNQMETDRSTWRRCQFSISHWTIWFKSTVHT